MTPNPPTGSIAPSCCGRAKKEVKPFIDYVRFQLEQHRKVALTPQAVAVAAPQPDIAGELEKLHGLLKQGILTQDEFDAKKRSLLEI